MPPQSGGCGCRFTSRVAAGAGISRRSAYKWIARHAREGDAGLRDRSSRPRSSPTALSIETVCCIVQLRQTRMTVAEVRARVGHPIIDADGHVLEFMPALLDCLRAEMGPELFARFQQTTRAGPASTATGLPAPPTPS